MRYMMLVYTQESSNATPEERLAVFSGHVAVQQETARRGIFRAADPLQPTTSATTVRVQQGKVLVTDGPFAETKEQLGGYYLVEAKTRDEAVAMAAKIPGARFGSVEVRPIMKFS